MWYVFRNQMQSWALVLAHVSVSTLERVQLFSPEIQCMTRWYWKKLENSGNRYRSSNNIQRRWYWDSEIGETAIACSANGYRLLFNAWRHRAISLNFCCWLDVSVWASHFGGWVVPTLSCYQHCMRLIICDTWSLMRRRAISLNFCCWLDMSVWASHFRDGWYPPSHASCTVVWDWSWWVSSGILEKDRKIRSWP